MRVLDIKTPGSGEAKKNRLANLALLTAHDQIKFVICDRMDYLWARDMLRDSQLGERCEVTLMYEMGSADFFSGYDILDVTPRAL